MTWNTLTLPRSLLLSLLLLLVLSLHGAAQANDIVDASALPRGTLVLTSHLDVLEDPAQQLTIDDVLAAGARFQASGQADEALSFGYTRSAYWLRLDLRNPGAAPLQRMLEISNARLSSITLYTLGADGRYRALHTGSAQPYATRPYHNRYFVFPLELAAHSQQVVYLRIASNGAKLIPARLWSPEAYLAYEGQDYLLQGVYFGMALAMMLFNLVLFATLGDRLYLMYVAFVGCVALGLAGQNGLAHEWLWPGAQGAWPNLAASILFSLSAALLLVFMRSMLGTRTLVPRLDKVLLALLAFFVLSPVAMVVFYTYVARPITTIWSVASPLIMIVSLVCAYKRSRSAYYFSGAFFVLLIGNMSSSLAAMALLPHNLLTNHGSQIGSACEMMLLAFALADRVHVMRREKAEARRAAYEAQSSLIASLQSSERLLEERVAQRTSELNEANARLAELSMTDSLTGIANRRRFDLVLATEWSRAARLERPLAVGLLDIDFFKRYNDHYGHQDGDACLRRVAAEFAAQLQRTGDMVARYGGEEFAFIAPATDADSALTIARRVCEALEALALPHAQAPGGMLTVSIGVAAWTPKAGESAEQLLRAADAALYRAKQLGRNRAELDA
ncbi:phytochrome-like protein cph2 [Duganella sp. HH101]|nr:phytochrome-like protein cph2 [Duganella sp. HH101]